MLSVSVDAAAVAATAATLSKQTPLSLGKLKHTTGQRLIYTNNQTKLTHSNATLSFSATTTRPDVILNFRTTFVNRKGEVVTRPKVS